ncbi:MAG: hypothetical protein QF878_06130 [SAR202 cluster bacterium]|jgi:hypothetical protein|nr:hypothetical protein [SAR202 cluster bacterium]MDP6714522.1 hypothetical protein [SAR202 cluster bacterium]
MAEYDGGVAFSSHFREVFYAVLLITIVCGLGVLYHPSNTDAATIQWLKTTATAGSGAIVGLLGGKGTS